MRLDRPNSTVSTATVIFALLSLWFLTATTKTLQLRRHAHQIYQSARSVLIDLLDAETGTRGYLLTGREEYLEPYNRGSAAVGPDLDRLATLVDPDEQPAIYLLRALTAEKLDELQHTIELRKDKGIDAALAVVDANTGKTYMDRTRKVLLDIASHEEARQTNYEATILARLAWLRTTVATMLALSLAYSLWVLFLGRKQ